MAFANLKPKALPKEVLQNISAQAQRQTRSMATPKSADPENFPVYTFSEKTDLIYVPNIVVRDADGVETLNWDKAFTHTVKRGRQYEKVRCIHGIEVESDELTYDGTCPICDAMEPVNELARLEAAKLLASNGYAENDDSQEAKDLTRSIFSNRIIKARTDSYTFPIAVFERTFTENPKTKVRKYELVYDDEGMPKYKLMWFTVSAALYHGTSSTPGKWEPVILDKAQELEEDFSTPAGLWFTIKGDYIPANDTEGKWSARDVARNYAVSMLAAGPKGLSEEVLDKLEEEIDEKAQEWTPEMSSLTVIANQYLPQDALQSEIEKLIEPIKEKIAMLNLGSVTSAPVLGTTAPAAQNAQAQLAALGDDEFDDLDE